MSTQLVIVESPTKARTIEKFLGKDFEVLASYGHIRDLPNNAAEIPAEIKKQKWSRLGINVDSDFTPLYIIPSEKEKRVNRTSCFKFEWRCNSRLDIRRSKNEKRR